MKIKIFSNHGNVPQLEEEINEWLNNDKIHLKEISQSSACDETSLYTTISVWYERKKDYKM
ncbi:MAG: hypothetical protein ABSB79_16650 [Syntrophales bacterium]|jgi:hypothetical protein